MSAITSAYVFGVSPTGDPVLAGELTLGRSGGQFRYSIDWLESQNAYPLDPQNLPLRDGIFKTDHEKGVFPVFSDAAPDAWGTRIMLLGHRSHPRNEIERLLRTSGNGVGSLQFSLSRTRPKAPGAAQPISMLNQLADVANKVDAHADLVPDLLRLIEPGSSMGGARPKVTVTDGGSEFIAKFSKATDIIDVPKAEYATMTLLAAAGLNVPEVRLFDIGAGKSAFLIKRFDRAGGRVIAHYVSAHSLFNQARLRSYSSGQQDPAGYVALSLMLRRHSHSHMEDCRELFRRIAANIALGNTDDHARNHGMIYCPQAGTWRLSPAFDVLPIVAGDNDQQALTIGEQGRSGTLENLMGVATAFGLAAWEAEDEVKQLLQHFSQWEPHFAQAGVSAQDIKIVSGLIGPRLEQMGAVRSAASMTASF